MPNPVSGDKVDSILTDFSVGLFTDNENYVFPRAFPFLGVQKQSDKYYKWDANDLRRIDSRVRAPGTEANIKGISLSNETYYCDLYDLRKPIPDEHRSNFAPLDLAKSYTSALLTDMMNKLEEKFVSSIMATSTWGSDFTGVASGATGDQFICFDTNGSDPVAAVRAGVKRLLRNSGKPATDIIMDAGTYFELLDHTSITGRVADSRDQIVTPEFLASLFGVKRVHISFASYNSAKEGLTKSDAFIASDKLLIYHRPESATGLDSPSAGMLFGWNGLEALSEVGTAVYRYYDDARHAEFVEVWGAMDFKVTSAPCGVLLTNTLNA